MNYPKTKDRESLVSGAVYVQRLEAVVKHMIEPLRDVPFRLVIESLSGHHVIPFKPDDKKDQSLLSLLKNVAQTALKDINKNGIRSRRPNEVGNAIESFVEKALIKSEVKRAGKPQVNGKTKSAGYPDLEFVDQNDRLNYLECKTFNRKNVETTQRSFYLSPSEDFKITQDAHHFVLSLEMNQKSPGVYLCQGWKVLSLEKLLVDVKHEFNSDNKRLYAGELLLAEGH